MTAVARAAAIPYYRRKLQRFEHMLHDAHAVQRRFLFEKLRRCADSRFGRVHGFGRIKTLDDFRKQVPISQYEYFAPYIQDVSQGRLDALFPPDEKVLMFGVTTGTTGPPKLNPVTATWLEEYRRSWEVWGVKSIFEHAEMIGTRLLQVTGPANLGRSGSGLPIGMISSVAVRYQNRVLRSFYSVPLEICDVGDPLSKYYTMLRLAMLDPVGFICTITPANLLRLAAMGNEHRESLIRDIHDGTLRKDVELTPVLRDRVRRMLAVRRPRRARELEQIVERTGTLYPKDYWPLSLVACWLGGTIGYQSRDLPRYYGSTPTRDLGLVSTEGRHTIPLHDDRPEGVLAVDGNYYEFVPVREMGSADPQTLECHELEVGGEYFLLMSTSSGLYRYDIDDVVRCNGYVGQAPVLEFLHKGSQWADMEGEKVSGHQVAQAVETAARELGLCVDCFTAVPVRNDGEVPYYTLLVERPAIEDCQAARKFLEIVDRELVRQNVMYAGKRNDRYIDAPRLARLAPGAWSEYTRVELRRGGTGESQYKHPAIVSDPAWLSRFQPIDTVTVG
ncbi:MAG TPA: GH3 auxin-responsive promoter family protein [Planctomycetaceae bacterium]|nr:GH3 auxin-responsive promoter family protein [Planctomycetaceae bacterium]